jgi:hypothetical protein
MFSYLQVRSSFPGTLEAATRTSHSFQLPVSCAALPGLSNGCLPPNSRSGLSAPAEDGLYGHLELLASEKPCAPSQCFGPDRNSEETFSENATTDQEVSDSSTSEWDVVGEWCSSADSWSQHDLCGKPLPESASTWPPRQIAGMSTMQSLAIAHDADQWSQEPLHVSLTATNIERSGAKANHVAWQSLDIEQMLRDQHGPTCSTSKREFPSIRRRGVPRFDSGEPIYKFGDGGGRPPENSVLYQHVRALDSPRI